MGDADSHYVNEKEIGTELLKVQNTPPTIPDKSIYTLIISILVPNTDFSKKTTSYYDKIDKSIT